MKKNKKFAIQIILSVSIIACFELHASRTYQISCATEERAEENLEKLKIVLKTPRILSIASQSVMGEGENLEGFTGAVSQVRETAEMMPLNREDVIPYVLRFLLSKIGEKPKVGQTISDQIVLANVLMEQTYFTTVRQHYGEDAFKCIFQELQEKIEANEALKDFWPRIITMLAMNKMAHTPFFLPNRFTLILRPFPPSMISFIDQELEKTTQFNSVNAILHWMRSNHFVKWEKEKPHAWDVHCLSRRIAIADGKWAYEENDPRRANIQQESLTSAVGGITTSYEQPYSLAPYLTTSKKNIESLVCNKHFPQETAMLFRHRDESAPDKGADFLVQLLMAKYASWLAKADKDGKKYMSFYDASKAECLASAEEGNVSAERDAASLTPHERAQDMSGAFPGMYAYEQMVLKGFKQPPALYEANLKSYTQKELEYQGLRYYVDAASRGLGVAIDYLRKRFPDYYVQHLIRLELEIADKKRAENTLYTLSWLPKHNVNPEIIVKLHEISGTKPFNPGSSSAPTISVMPPPSPRKTPAKRGAQLLDTQNGSVIIALSPGRAPSKMNLECIESIPEKKGDEKIERKNEKKEKNASDNLIYQ